MNITSLIKVYIILALSLCFIVPAVAFPFDITTSPSSAAVTTVDNITLKVTEVRNIEKGEVIAVNIEVWNNSPAVLSTGIEDFSLGGSPALANAVQLFLIEKDRSNRMINIIPYVGTVTAVVSTPEADMLQDMVNASYHGGLVLPAASRSGYVFFRNVKNIKDFRMYAIYNGELLTIQLPVVVRNKNTK